MSEEKKLAVNDLMALFKAQKYEHLIEFSSTEQDELFAALFSENFIQLQQKSRYDVGLLRYFAQELQDDIRDYALFALGGLQGATRLMGEILSEYAQDQWIERYKKEIQTIKHLPEIIRALETHGPMTHREISDSLDMNPSTLTEAMKKIVDTGVIHASSIGKYKLYALTDTGLRTGRLLRKDSELPEATDQKMQRLFLELQTMLTQFSDTEAKERIKQLIRLTYEDSGEALIQKNTLLKIASSDGTKFVEEAYVVDEVQSGTLRNEEVRVSAHKTGITRIELGSIVNQNNTVYTVGKESEG